MRHGWLEFFAGAGMARLGLGEAQWRCLWANDIDPHKAEVYASWFGDAADHLTVGDVGELEASALPAGAALAWASFPCQDLSLAGWGRGMSARRSGTFWAFWRLMHDLHAEGRRPPLIVLENVVGLLRPDEFVGLAEALAALDMKLGALVVDARHFVPQSRPRVFVVASDERIDVTPWSLPKADSRSPWHTDALARAHAALSPAVRQAWVWWQLPSAPDHASPPRDLSALIPANPPDAQWHDAAETAYLISLMAQRHRDRVEAPPEGIPVGTLYKRTRDGRQRAEVRFDGLAGCLRTPQGGSSRQTVVDTRGGLVRTRLLTSREAARLMGVPDSLPLPKRYNQAYKAMGDGVAVPVVRHLAAHLLTPLADAAQGLQATSRRHPTSSTLSARARRRETAWRRG